MPSEQTRSGFAGLVGRPNVGKSTLLNRLSGAKLAIVSPKPQTTRGRIVGVISRPTGQVALVDTPGLRPARGALSHHLQEVSMRVLEEVDLVLLLTDAIREREAEIVRDERPILARLKELRKNTFLLINKIDRVRKPLLLPLIDRYRQQASFAEVLPISAKTGENLEALESAIFAHLPLGPPMFEESTLTDQTEHALAAELIREQILLHYAEEIPHACAVEVEEFDESRRGNPPPGLVRIAASIIVERESQKAMVIGKGGRMLRELGTGARKEIERLLGARVYLSLHVKVEPRWTSDARSVKKTLLSTGEGWS